MSTLNDKLVRNNPVWNGATTSAAVTLTGAGTRDVVPLVGTYIIISNTSAQVLTVHVGDTAPGIDIQVDGSFEIGLGPQADIRVSVAGAASACDVVQFV